MSIYVYLLMMYYIYRCVYVYAYHVYTNMHIPGVI